MARTSCAYCESQDIKDRTITRNALAWAFPTNIPIVPGHVLICPVRCVATFDELNNEEKAAIFELAGQLRIALAKTFDAAGFNYAVNEGAVAGQSIPHFHLHMLPRKAGDTGITEYEPRQFLYRPGTREATAEDELREVARLIRGALA